MDETHEWWQHGVIYQIYPRSFQDSNGDGIGDLEGILSRLDYIQWLGVDAVWLSPIYPSPMADFGYDISDYAGIDPIFGTMDDFDRLLDACHRRGLKLILDFVPNHTSDQHPWFMESRSSRTNPKRDWYIWRDPGPGGGPPNNWLSNFGGGAWEYDERTGQYYYHAFLKEQPDLNWRSREVQDAMLDVLRFWLERGVDGFRVDVIWHIVKDEEFRNNPPNPEFGPGQPPHHELLATYNTDRPEVHDIIERMRAVFDEYGERMMVGEIYLPVERLVTYYGAHGSGVHLPFNFQLINIPWNARTIERTINNYEAALPPYGWPNWVLGNHDQPRIASRVGCRQARVAAMLLLTLRGTPTMYFGDEIGMHNVPIPPHLVQDPFEKLTPGLGLGRDPQRSPMRWTAEPRAGFTSGQPWLPLPPDFERVNVEAIREDPKSILTLYRRLLALRKKEPALAIGDYHHVPAEGNLLAYVRRWDERQFLIVLNLCPQVGAFGSEFPIARGRIAISTHLDRAGEKVEGSVTLRPDEGVIIDREESRAVPGWVDHL
jgi:alpha-glucosidase